MNVKDSILVVDDDSGFLQVIGTILRAKGYDAETVPSAAEAIEKVKARFFNIAILDISLPDIDGIELLSRLSEIQPDMMAIFLTGHSSVKNTVQALNKGAFGYLEKPVDTNYLLSVIARGLEK
jgi:DNA-binding NtrC family response regulator